MPRRRLPRVDGGNAPVELLFVERLFLGPLFALVAAALVGVLRGFGPLGRLRLWAMATGLFAGAWLALADSGLHLEQAIRSFLLAATILAATAALLRLFDLVFWDWFLARRRHIPVPRLAVDLFKLLAMAGVLIAVMKFVFGMELSGLLVTSTVVSAVIGLAVQDLLQNVASGLGVQMERPFKVGDWLVIGGHEGIVTQLNWRTLTLLTRDGHEVLVPNSMVARGEVINFSRPGNLQRCHVFVGLGYGDPPAKVKAALARAAQACPEVAEDPPVEVLLREYADSSISYDVRYWIRDYGRLLQIRDDVQTRIWYELRREGLAIPFPIRDVNMRTVSDDQARREAERGSREIFSVLRRLSVFDPLSDEQVETLVGGAVLQAFTRGETLVRQGERGDSLFVIRSGRVRIEKSVEGEPARTITRMDAGDFFGEMSLLTGEPRTASIVAEDETEVVVVRKEAFAPVLVADAGILTGLTTVLEERARRTAEHLANFGDPDLPLAQSVQSSRALLLRIRRFFALDES